jgi:hypothetical protein
MPGPVAIGVRVDIFAILVRTIASIVFVACGSGAGMVLL